MNFLENTSQPVLNIHSLVKKLQRPHGMRQMDITWKWDLMHGALWGGCWADVSCLVSHDSSVRFALGMIYASHDCALTIHPTDALLQTSPINRNMKKSHKKPKIRTSISKTASTTLNRYSFFINCYSTNSTKYGKK